MVPETCSLGCCHAYPIHIRYLQGGLCTAGSLGLRVIIGIFLKNTVQEANQLEYM